MGWDGSDVGRYRTSEEVDREYRSTIEAAIDRITNKRYANTFVHTPGYISQTLSQELYNRGFHLEVYSPPTEVRGCIYLMSPLLRD